MIQSLNKVQMRWSSLLACAACCQHTYFAYKTPSTEQADGCTQNTSQCKFDRRTDRVRQTDRHTDRHIDRHTDDIATCMLRLKHSSTVLHELHATGWLYCVQDVPSHHETAALHAGQAECHAQRAEVAGPAHLIRHEWHSVEI